MEGNVAVGEDHHRYHIRIRGVLDPRWAVWFDGMVITHDPDGTTLLSGWVGQAALYGIIARLRNLGTTLLSIAYGP